MYVFIDIHLALLDHVWRRIAQILYIFFSINIDCTAEGLLVQRDWKTDEGFNAVFVTNVVGHFLLVCCLCVHYTIFSWWVACYLITNNCNRILSRIRSKRLKSYWFRVKVVSCGRVQRLPTRVHLISIISSTKEGMSSCNNLLDMSIGYFILNRYLLKSYIQTGPLWFIQVRIGCSEQGSKWTA